MVLHRRFGGLLVTGGDGADDGRVLVEGLSGDGRVVLQAELIDVRCDPEVPPIPPHATFDQMKSMAESILKGDPNAWHVIMQGIQTKAEELLPGKRS